MKKSFFFELKGSLILFIIYSLNFYLTSAAVSLTTDGLNATVENDLVSIVFKSDAMVSSVTVNGQNIAATNIETFFIDYHYNDDLAYYAPTELTVIENTPTRAHFYWLQKNRPGLLRTELHYLIEDGLSGIYTWVKCENDHPINITVAITRMVYRFNPDIFIRGTNMVRDEKLYTYAYLFNQTSVQDETWQLPDGSYYTKYDFAGYFRETPYQGVYGNGYGAFLLSGSREYYSGGPLRQDLLIHQDSLIINIFFGTHLGTSGVTTPPGWSHIYGPCLLYFPLGSDHKILADVKARAVVEQNNWPYTFVGDSEYPIERGNITGHIIGQKNATVFLCDSTNEPFEAQALGYVFSTRTDSKGHFNIKNIRPGKYNLVAYPTAGNGSENIVIKTVTIAAGDNQNVGTLNLPEPDNIMWALGEANRRSDGFKYSNESRNYVWQTLTPAMLTFTIGESNVATDWYYAQTKPGNWTIQYNDTDDGNSRTLRVALAGASRDPDLLVYVNGRKIGNIICANDHAIYRSAMLSGTFYSALFTIKSAHVINGINDVTFHIAQKTGQVMYDAISLQRNES